MSLRSTLCKGEDRCRSKRDARTKFLGPLQTFRPLSIQGARGGRIYFRFEALTARSRRSPEREGPRKNAGSRPHRLRRGAIRRRRRVSESRVRTESALPCARRAALARQQCRRHQPRTPLPIPPGGGGGGAAGGDVFAPAGSDAVSVVAQPETVPTRAPTTTSTWKSFLKCMDSSPTAQSAALS
jgi:hypothetical protein